MKSFKLRGYRIYPDGHLIKGCQHGPRTWPFWRQLSVNLVRCVPFGIGAWNLWIYTRWGGWCVGIHRVRTEEPPTFPPGDSL